MDARLVGPSRAEIRQAALLLAGVASRLSEELYEGDEPDFGRVGIDLWRARHAVEALDRALKWRLSMDPGEQVSAADNRPQQEAGGD